MQAKADQLSWVMEGLEAQGPQRQVILDKVMALEGVEALPTSKQLPTSLAVEVLMVGWKLSSSVRNKR